MTTTESDLSRASDFPLLVSVDDHVMEPPRLWLDKVPARYAERVPHIVRERVPSVINPGTEKWADVWYYGNDRVENHRGVASVGFDADELDTEPMTFDEMRPGCYAVPERLADMDIDGVEASASWRRRIRKSR